MSLSDSVNVNRPDRGNCLQFNLHREAKILLAIGIIALIGALLSIALSTYFFNPSHWLFYTGCGVTFLSALSLSLVHIVNKFLIRTPAAELIRPPQANSNLNIGAFIETEGDITATYQWNEERISLTVAQSNVKNEPARHLELFAQNIQLFVRISSRGIMHVKFEGQRGVDGGGLTRTYLDDLFSNLASNTNCPVRGGWFTMLGDTSLAVPNAATGCNLEIYEQIGQVMAFCYNHNPIGVHFDSSLFIVAFALSANELNAPFEHLSFERKRELYEMLFSTQDDQNYRWVLNLIDQDEWSDQELGCVVQHLNNCVFLPDEFNDEDIQTIKCAENYQGKLKGALKEAINEFLDPQLRGTHAIAKGMKSVRVQGRVANPEELNTRWDQEFFCNQPIALKFGEKLQGKIDRRYIAGQIQRLGGGWSVWLKVRWLKQWICSEATEEKIKAFLKFMTGSTGLPTGRNLAVMPLNSAGIYPIAHTCSFFMQMPVVWQTREVFIRTMEDALILSADEVNRL